MAQYVEIAVNITEMFGALMQDVGATRFRSSWTQGSGAVSMSGCLESVLVQRERRTP